jgi:hypothetical protein
VKLPPADLTVAALFVLSSIALATLDDPRWLRQLKALWSDTVGAWFARRRIVGDFNKKPRARIVVGRPDEHSRGIMSARRDINTGVWS